MSIYCNFVENYEPRARSLIEFHPSDDGTDDPATNILASTPKLCSGPTKPTEEIWTVRQGQNGEEELYAKAKSVYWTRNNRIVKSFNFTDQVVKVFWSEFSEGDHVVIALTSGLSIFNKAGQHFQIPLPFPHHDMYISKLGILIERSFDSLEESSSLPVLFSLTHPTREIAPILFKPPSRSSLTYIVPSFMSIVACHDKLSLCLMYNSQECRHSIWRLRKATDEEIDGFQKDTTHTYNQSSCSFIIGNLAASRLGAGVSQMTPDHNRSLKNMTPNRNRIINYLRDNIEDPILPELTCEQIWSESSTNSPKGTKFFSTRDFVGDQFLIIVIPASSQIKIIKIDLLSEDPCNVNMSKMSHIAAIDAMPICELSMMIVLECNKNLALYSGLDRVTNVNIKQLSSPIMPLPTSTPSANKGSGDTTPIQMSSARKRISTGDCSSIDSDISIQQMLALSPVPHANKHDAIKKIEYVMGNTVFVRGLGSKQACFQVPSVSQTQIVERLIEAMKRLVPREQGLTITSQWYQTRRASSQPELMLARDEIRLFRNWFLNYIGIESNIFEAQDLNSLIVGKSAFPSPNKKTRRGKDPEGIVIASSTYNLFFALHLVLEDLLLVKLCYDNACDLAELQLALACLLRLNTYQNYYWLKFPHLQERYGHLKEKFENLLSDQEPLKPAFFRANPPSVIEFLERIISAASSREDENIASLEPYPNLDNITSETYAVISLFCEMFNVDKTKAIVRVSAITSTYPETNVLTTRPRRSTLADQAVVICMVKLGKNRNYLSRLPAGYNLYLWDAILNCRESPPTDWCEGCFELIGRMDLVSLVRGYNQVIKVCDSKTSEENEDETLRLLFPDDIRVLEAQRMLASNLPVEFSITSRQGATEEESRDETHRHLYLLNVRTMGMPVGRGAISLRTYPPVIGESFVVPRLELSGRVMSEDRPIEYTHDISVYPWPFFHNGVAAGLTISAASANNIIDSTWINYNRPRSNIAHGMDIRDRDLTTVNINNEHAGFLFALGLNGHLEKLSLMALHDYLCQNNDLTKLAILLGMSAAKRGSRDNNIIKVLSIHVDALLPPNSTELDVPAPVHAASIIGVGLLYSGSADSHISKVLLEEIGRLPGPETNSHVDRESYSLSAGLAFGLVNLCKGGLTTISSSDQLRLYMLGGKRRPLTLAQRERYFKQDCHRGEEEYINTHITGPGGTLGLGLMYHRSGNQSVANWMRAPDTQTLLEYVRPDFLILRMLSYGLIMWDEVEPNETWIDSHIPKIVSTHAFQRNLNPAPRLGDSNTSLNPSVDYELISQVYCNIIAGCCMAIALRYAGTANRDAYATIYKHIKMLITLSNKPALVEQAGKPCIEACLNVLVTSLAVVMAGTGDLGVMRVCRYLRSRLTQSCVFYGSYMAVHMAIGILFLGACRYSFSTSPDSIGALVCALYPIYPNHSSDNRYHLQALRHLYVLAAEPRLLIPRDITTNKPAYVNITIRQKNATTGKTDELKLRAPCLVPEVNSIENVFVDDERYWRIDINDRAVLMRCLLKDNGFLSVKRKAHSSNNQLVQDIETHVLQNMPKGCGKSRKERALRECVKEDRVEQFSAINELLTKCLLVDSRFRNLVLEQLRLACSLVDNQVTNKLNMLKPVIGKLNDSLSSRDVYSSWFAYLGQKTDWTNTDLRVAQYIVLNDLRCSMLVDTDMLRSLRDLELHTKQTA